MEIMGPMGKVDITATMQRQATHTFCYKAAIGQPVGSHPDLFYLSSWMHREQVIKDNKDELRGGAARP